MVKHEMVNENYEPNDREKTILSLFKQGRDTGEPWGRVNPLYLRENSELDKGQVEYALRNLKNAGWVEQLNQGGLYELVEDPRAGENK
jgi:DNA-binding IclR family transcriptional regulator